MPFIFDIKRFALHDGPGIRTTVFFKGCPLRCMWCHNPESHERLIETQKEKHVIDGREITRTRVYGRDISENDLFNEIVKDRAFYEESGGGVTFSGGEPLQQYDALLSMLKKLSKNNIHRAVDTSGFAPQEKLQKVAEESDLLLYDLKIMDPERHKKYTGVDNHLIIENADFLLKQGHSLIFRIPIIPGINDSDKDIDAFIQFLDKRSNHFEEIHLLPYHRIGTDKYRRMEKEYAFTDLETPSEDAMQKFKYKFDMIGKEISIGG